jgi:glycosyltransferase involved in cell wall biosynthesis
VTSNLVGGAAKPDPAAPSPAPDRPLVSVLIPAYNVEEFVAAAIESALVQTYPHVEVVVVNDGSTDGTAAAIAPFRDRIVYVDQPNRGLAGARNAAIAAASGPVLALLDADDLWLPDRLEQCVALLEQQPEVGLVTSDAFLIEDGLRTARRCYGDRRRYPFPAPDADQLDVISHRNFLFVSVVFRRALVERCGGFDETLPRAEDYELWTRFLLSGARAACVPEPLGYYRRRPDSLSASPDQWDAHLTVLERHLPELWRRGATGRPRDMFEIGQRLAARGDRRGAAMFFSRACRAPGVPVETRVRYAGGAIRRLVRGTVS